MTAQRKTPKAAVPSHGFQPLITLHMTTVRHSHTEHLSQDTGIQDTPECGIRSQPIGDITQRQDVHHFRYVHVWACWCGDCVSANANSCRQAPHKTQLWCGQRVLATRFQHRWASACHLDNNWLLLVLVLGNEPFWHSYNMQLKLMQGFVHKKKSAITNM